MKSKASSLKKVNEINKPLVWITKEKKKGKTQITDTGNERGVVSADPCGDGPQTCMGLSLLPATATQTRKTPLSHAAHFMTFALKWPVVYMTPFY